MSSLHAFPSPHACCPWLSFPPFLSLAPPHASRKRCCSRVTPRAVRSTVLEPSGAECKAVCVAHSDCHGFVIDPAGSRFHCRFYNEPSYSLYQIVGEHKGKSKGHNFHILWGEH